MIYEKRYELCELLKMAQKELLEYSNDENYKTEFRQKCIEYISHISNTLKIIESALKER